MWKNLVSYINLEFLMRYHSKAGLILLVFILLLLSTSLQGNSSLKDSISEYKAKAVKYDRKKDVYNAIVYYNRYLHYKNKDAKTSYRLATLYFSVRDYNKAYQLFDSVIRLNKTKYPLAYYFKGNVCMNLEKYDEAIESLAKFKKLYRKDDSNNYRKIAAVDAERCEWARNNSNDNGEISISNPGEALNHSKIDFAPFPLDENTIIYGAIATGTDNIPVVRQIYKAVKTDDQWKSAGLWENGINNPEFNTGNAVVSEDRKKIYFTRTRQNWKGQEICEIYFSIRDGEKWSDPEKMPYPVNDENYTTTQPALGKNVRTGNEILYFVSDRPGGKGGSDIWYTEYNSRTNTYKQPQDLDKGVNTAGEECCPFYDFTTQTLYFSSKGRKTGWGGFDIFKTTGSTKRWTEAFPLPKPVNSSYDDYYFSIFKNNKEGFFSSNRPGSMTLGNGNCCDDIFTFKINHCALINAVGTVRNSVNDDVYETLREKYQLEMEYPKDSSVLANIPVELYLSDASDEDEILISKTVTDHSGNFHFGLERDKNYKVLIKNYGYFEKKVAISTLNRNCADTFHIGTTLISYLPKVNVKINIYYDHDNFKLSSTALQTIDTTLMHLLDLFPNAIVEIGSHTDSTGTGAYNIKLSQRRSESVVNYLISKGINKERLIAKGYGMQLPIAPNTNSDGIVNEAGMQLNRRTEIKIVGEISSFYPDEE